MTNPSWNFTEIKPGIPERNPHEGEFFRITDPSSSLIREFVQNSLDARTNETDKVRVVISYGMEDKRNLRIFFNGLESHLSAEEIRTSGIIDKIPDSISYIVLEDFGTTGLDGSIEWASYSNFSKFWHGEGTSFKKGKRGGRWGLGKTTFHLVSKIRSFWGLTVRHDDRKELLMGKSLLRTHRIGGKIFNYAGYYVSNGWQPIEERSLIKEFKEKFKIQRDSEPGLSIVIPLPDEEITEENLLRAIIMHYFYAIINGLLEVELRDPGDRSLIVNEENLLEIAGSLAWESTEWEEINVSEVLEFIMFTKRGSVWTLNIFDPERPEINENSFTNLEDLKNSFKKGEICGFKVPVNIQQKDGQESQTYFKIYIKKSPDLVRSQEFYVRSGILISEIKTLGNKPVMALLVAEEEPIARFLGDCETPAHTDWNERTEGFKEKYKNAARVLRFIKKSVRQILSILDEPPPGRHDDFLKEIFSIPFKTDPTGGDGKPEPPKIPAKRNEQIFSISKNDRGFIVTFNREYISTVLLPLRAILRVAYDTRRGDPFRQYEVFDFRLDSQDIVIKAEGCDVINVKENQIELLINSLNFKIALYGFDPNRDLVVDVKEIMHEKAV